MMSKDLLDYIQQRRALFWFTPDDHLEGVSLSFLTETVLNYGTLEDVRELFAVAGIDNVAKVFRRATQKSERNNYFPEVTNYFTLYFNKYVSQSID